MLLINFFISYSRGKTNQPFHRSSQKAHQYLSEQMMAFDHTVMELLDVTVKAGPMQTPSKSRWAISWRKQTNTDIALKRAVRCQSMSLSTMTQAFKIATMRFLNTLAISSSSRWHNILESVKPQFSMLGHYTSRYFSEPVSVNSFTKGGKGSHELLPASNCIKWLWLHVSGMLNLLTTAKKINAMLFPLRAQYQKPEDTK